MSRDQWPKMQGSIGRPVSTQELVFWREVGGGGREVGGDVGRDVGEGEREVGGGEREVEGGEREVEEEVMVL